MKRLLFTLGSIVVCTASSFATDCISITQPSNAAFTAWHAPLPVPVFGAFNAHRQQNGVALSWNVDATTDVVAFSIERSYDGSFFETIGGVPAALSAWQRFKDDAVFPGLIYYRVAAHLTDGTTVHSAVQTVRIVSKK